MIAEVSQVGQVQYPGNPVMYGGQLVTTPPAYGVPTAPPAQQQIVIVQQQPVAVPGALQVYPQNTREWDTGLCACCDDMESCCCVYFCPCVEMCKIARALNEECVCCLCLAACQRYPVCLPLIRTKTRAMMGIRGSVCGDLLCTGVCTACVMCQVSRQLKAAHLM